MIPQIIFGALSVAAVGGIIILTTKSLVKTLRIKLAEYGFINHFQIHIKEIFNSPDRTVLKFSALDKLDSHNKDFEYIINGETKLDDSIYEGQIIDV